MTRDSWAGPGLVAAVALAGLAAAALLHRERPAWREVQERYLALHPGFAPGLRTAGGEHCATCHLAGAGYEPADEAPFSAHPAVGHDPLDLGCTACHAGDGASLARHREPAYGRDPPLPGRLAWVACLRCHDPDREDLGAWPALAGLRERIAGSVERAGCAACHRLVGRGGLVGPDLTTFAKGPVSDPTAPTAGRFAQAGLQLEDPAALQVAPRMPTPDLDSEEREVLAAWLALAGRATAPTAWDPVAPRPDPDGEVVFRRFCSPCHGSGGEGRERGRPPGAVPALASPLWLAYVPPALVRATVRQGREGSQMEGFASDDAEPILQGAEVDAVLDVVLTGGLAAEADPATRARVAAGSCEACHPRRGDYVDGRDESARAAFLSDHPWRWSLADWLTDEGLALGDCAEEVEREDGSRARVHGGERLYGALCVGCHEDPERAPPGQEPAAPALRGVLRREHFDVGYLLAGLILGRADAAPVKWRHQGITRAEYTAEQLACVARWLEETP